MVVALIAASMTLYVKIERRLLIGLIASGTLAVPVVWSFLKGYQKQRILTFLNPDRDPLGAGYHIIQSKIAIGSGMLTGKGFLKGTQNSLDFLPEQHTDFIFSVLAEEWGLVGAALVLLVFMLLITWGLQIAQRSRDPFGTIMAVGITHNDRLAGLYQYWYGDGIDARRWGYVAIRQLWGIIYHYNDGRGGAAPQCQHAQVHV